MAALAVQCYGAFPIGAFMTQGTTASSICDSEFHMDDASWSRAEMSSAPGWVPRVTILDLGSSATVLGFEWEGTDRVIFNHLPHPFSPFSVQKGTGDRTQFSVLVPWFWWSGK